MSNRIIRALAAQGQVRALAITATELVEEARQRHDTWPTTTAALGRTLMAVAMLGVTLKNDENITLRIQGDGPMGTVIAQSRANGTVRGYVQEPHTHVPPKHPGKLDVGSAVGKGFIHITRDMGLKEPYTGTAELVSGEIAEDLAYYFAQSEQTPSIVALGVLVGTEGQVEAAGGYLVQLLPQAEEAVIQQLEANVEKVRPVTDLVAEGMAGEDMLHQVLQGLDVEIVETRETGFVCNCSKERLSRVLISLGSDQLSDLADEGGIELVCHFCGDKYYFEADELTKLLEESRG